MACIAERVPSWGGGGGRGDTLLSTTMYPDAGAVSSSFKGILLGRLRNCSLFLEQLRISKLQLFFGEKSH